MLEKPCRGPFPPQQPVILLFCCNSCPISFLLSRSPEGRCPRCSPALSGLSLLPPCFPAFSWQFGGFQPAWQWQVPLLLHTWATERERNDFCWLQKITNTFPCFCKPHLGRAGWSKKPKDTQHCHLPHDCCIFSLCHNHSSRQQQTHTSDSCRSKTQTWGSADSTQRAVTPISCSGQTGFQPDPVRWGSHNPRTNPNPFRMQPQEKPLTAHGSPTPLLQKHFLQVLLS